MSCHKIKYTSVLLHFDQKEEYACGFVLKFKEELKRIKEFFSYTGAILGCVDTVQLKDGRDLILEYNGSATGLGYPEGPYDCNRIVAQKINNLI